MPSYFVVQPNGLLARFSTVVDDFTAMNMTDMEATEELFDEYSERAKHDAEQAITRAKRLKEDRWDSCLETIRNIHGDEAVAERLKWLGPDEPVPANPPSSGVSDAPEWTPGPWKTAKYDQPVTVCGQQIPCFEVESDADACKGQTSGFAGQCHTAESRAKIAQTSQARGAVPYLKNGVHWLKGTSGAVNPHWRGGITPERQTFYRSPEWKACIKIVWKRDNATCQRCALDYRTVDRASRRFDIHHVDSFAIVNRRADPDNLVLLCETCHYWIHSKQNTARLFLGDGHERQLNEAA